MCERELETEQNCNILTPYSIGHNRLSFPFFWAAQPGARGPGGPASLGHVPQSSIFSQLIWSPNCWISCALSYIIVQRQPSSCGVTISNSFNLSMVKDIISWYSSTGCTCYLHWCISYFDNLAGSEVNMQQYTLCRKKYTRKLERKLMFHSRLVIFNETLPPPDT